MKNYIYVVYLTICLLGTSLVSDAVAFEPYFTDYKFDNAPAPTRITESTPPRSPAISGSFYSEMSSSYPLRDPSPTMTQIPDSVQVEKYGKIYQQLAKGEYDGAVKDLKTYVDELIPYWDDWEKCALVSKLQRILANAYELNGEWNNALGLYAIVCGDRSKEFEWAKIRVLYANGRNKEVYLRVMKILEQSSWASPDSVVTKIENFRKDAFSNKNHLIMGSDESLPLMIKDGLAIDYEWETLWKLRDNCARVICPELYYVTAASTLFEPNARNFFELQQISFEKFIIFMEKEWETLEKPILLDKNKEREYIEFLRKLNQVPYDVVLREKQ